MDAAVHHFLASLPPPALDPKLLSHATENHLRIFQGRLSYFSSTQEEQPGTKTPQTIHLSGRACELRNQPSRKASACPELSGNLSLATGLTPSQLATNAKNFGGLGAEPPFLHNHKLHQKQHGLVA